ncbi:MAG: hypothetical protein ACI9XP_001236, partial [Lentimonas sp.]
MKANIKLHNSIKGVNDCRILESFQQPSVFW